MSEVILCNQALRADFLQKSCGIDFIEGPGCSTPSYLSPYTPYLSGEILSDFDRRLVNQLAPKPVSKELTNLALSFGGDNVIALSEISSKFQKYTPGIIGASTAVYTKRIDGFSGAIKDYQDALMAYRHPTKSNPSAKALTKQKIFTSYHKLQAQFGLELNAVTAQVKSSRGTPLSNPKRGMNIARSNRNVAKLNLTTQIQADNLVKFGKHAKFLGGGLAVIDFGSRVGNVQTSYQADGNWERDLFIESSSFVASAATGTLMMNAGLGILLIATPAGWIGLISGGIAIAGAATAGSIQANYFAQKLAGPTYDWIMRKLEL